MLLMESLLMVSEGDGESSGEFRTSERRRRLLTGGLGTPEASDEASDSPTTSDGDGGF